MKKTKNKNSNSLSDFGDSVSATDELSDLTNSKYSRVKFDMTVDAIFINYFHPSVVYNKVTTLLDLVSHLTFKSCGDYLVIEF